jgi:L-ribulose-5-phosphate 3-epimerase
VDFGYVTNGFRDHFLEDIFTILAELGYRGVGITLDVGHLHPYRSGRAEVEAVRESLQKYGLQPVVETGARYVLDPRRKHWPTLISAVGREWRRDFLHKGLEIAQGLGAKVVSLWSGARDPAVDREASWRFLVEGVSALEKDARARGLVLGFEPEPGMFVSDLAGYRELRARLDRRTAPALKLTLDLGHLHVTEEPPFERWIEEFREDLVNVHLDDVSGRDHGHLFFGEGDVDFPPLLRALEKVGYRGLGLVELTRHSYSAPDTAARAIGILRSYLRAS